ncbi:hypothetical protein C8R46DRAFT_1203251 [Mycena filopes]|nr:hypothetical protein C8R46DRAFT_1203251 [Mycena filopes]
MYSNSVRNYPTRNSRVKFKPSTVTRTAERVQVPSDHGCLCQVTGRLGGFQTLHSQVSHLDFLYFVERLLLVDERSPRRHCGFAEARVRGSAAWRERMSPACTANLKALRVQFLKSHVHLNPVIKTLAVKPLWKHQTCYSILNVSSTPSKLDFPQTLLRPAPHTLKITQVPPAFIKLKISLDLIAFGFFAQRLELGSPQFLVFSPSIYSDFKTTSDHETDPENSSAVVAGYMGDGRTNAVSSRVGAVVFIVEELEKREWIWKSPILSTPTRCDSSSAPGAPSAGGMQTLY